MSKQFLRQLGCVVRGQASRTFAAADNRNSSGGRSARLGTRTFPGQGLLLELLRPSPFHFFHNVLREICSIHRSLLFAKTRRSASRRRETGWDSKPLRNLLFQQTLLNVQANQGSRPKSTRRADGRCRKRWTHRCPTLLPSHRSLTSRFWNRLNSPLFEANSRGLRCSFGRPRSGPASSRAEPAAGTQDLPRAN